MKRSPLKRKTELRPSKPLQQKTPLRKRNPKRAAKTERECFGAHARWVRTLPCCICGAHPSEAAHAKSRGAGGKSRDLVNLCHTHHAVQHQMGIRTFAREHQIDLAAHAAELWAISPARNR